MKSGLSCLLSRLRRDERGSIMVQATLIVVVIMGMIGLALDGGRLFMANNDLQDLADAAALASAAKLNGTLNARQRAEDAARSMGDACARSTCNNVRWYDLSAPKILPGTDGVQFYETLANLDANIPAPDDKRANYIKVTTGAWEVAPTFLAAVGARSSNSAQATAVAEANVSMCLPASMMLCNPSEPLTGSTGNTSSFNPTPGQMFVFSTRGNTGRFSPGVFNLLDDQNGCDSDPCVKRLLSLQIPDFCVTGGTSPAQGQKTNATIDGINVRFDQRPSGDITGMDLAPSPIVIDGISPIGRGNICSRLGSVTPPGFQYTDVDPRAYDTACNVSPPSGSCPMPRDRSFTAVGGSGGSQIGNGPNVNDLNAYWQNHHGANWPTDPTTGRPLTRYEAYQQEVPVAEGGLGTVSFARTDSLEPSAPVCSSRTTEPAPTRRVVPVAVVDCIYWGVQGNSINNIRTNTYAEFFITEPTPCARCTGAGKIYTEFVSKHRIDQHGSALHSVVRLVR
jgi:Putative Flp pilus-assembly TadE/G-like